MSNVVFVAMAILAAQAGNPASFDELASRAANSLDSNPEQAIVLYRQALEIRPSWPDGWLYTGASLFQLGRYGEARDALKKGAELAPNKGTGWAFLGLSEYGLKDYDRALEHIRKGESLGLADNPGFTVSVHQCAARIYLKRADFRSAIEQLRPLVTLGVESPEAMETMGLGVLGIGDSAIPVPPERRALVTLAGRAAWAFFAQRPEQAKDLFQQLAAQFPKEPGVHYASGVFLLDRDPGAALSEFQKEISINPAHISARLQIVAIEGKLGDDEGALKSARQAVELAPENFACQVALGRALLEADKPEEAIASLVTAIKLAPDNAQSHFYLEQAYRRAGNDVEAKKEKATFVRLRAEQEPLNLPLVNPPLNGSAR